jgi:hypothetical protein
MRWRREFAGETGLLIGLWLFAVVSTILIITQESWASLNLLLIPMVIGSLVLSPRRLSWFVIGMLALDVVGLAGRDNTTPLTATAVICVFLVGLIILLSAFRRTRLGVAGAQGESMFVELRDRLLRQAKIPALPEGWLVESALTSAGGTLFAGDFIVAARTEERFEVALVDVSGKGEDAGPRALLLCGAFGGLIGSVPPAAFLPAANDFLLRQEWDEGFATAVHLSVDLGTGDYELRTAGHPPALLRHSGRWDRIASGGVFLGLIPHEQFEPARGRLDEGEAIMVYTDGVVEEPTRDLDVGIDLLAAEAEEQMRVDLIGAAQRLVTKLGARDDDRTMVVVHRL